MQTRGTCFKKLENLQKKEEEEDKFCRCNKSNCLKLYCSCFKKKQPCNEECKCHCCHNNEKFVEKQKLAIMHYEKIKAFDKFNLKYSDSHEFTAYCKCGKNCNNLRCVCYKRNQYCFDLCKCKSCKNKKLGFQTGKSNENIIKF